jgi:hypothetical protein
MQEEQKAEQQAEEGQEQPSPQLTPMQRRWIYHLYAGITWGESASITDEEEQKFLLARCWEMKQARDKELESEAAKEQAMEEQVRNMHTGLQGKIDALPSDKNQEG